MPTQTEVEIIDCPDCDGKGSVVDSWPSRVNRPGEEQTVPCTHCDGRGEVEALCAAGECNEPRKPGDSLCAECAEIRDEARRTYRKPYSRAEIDSCYSEPSERAKHDSLVR